MLSQFIIVMDLYKISVRLNNAYKRFLSESGMAYAMTFAEYCNLHKEVWTNYNSPFLGYIFKILIFLYLRKI